MKKLKLKLDGIKEMLSKEQMKKINGGYDLQDVRCIIVYDLHLEKPVWTEFLCTNTTDTSYCAGMAGTFGCPSSCYVDTCYVF